MDSIGTSLDYLAKAPGKRILLIATSGFLSGTFETQEDAITNEALRAGVVINSIDAKGLYAEPPGPPIDEPVQSSAASGGAALVYQIESLSDRLESLDAAGARFAESTGGLLFQNNNDLQLGFHQLGIAPEYAYILGIPPAQDGKYHRIKVELRNVSHDSVQVRPGYFAPTAASAEQPTTEDKIDAEIRGSDERTDIPVTVYAKVGATASGGQQLTIQSHLDIEKIPFEQQQDRHLQKRTFVAALFDQESKFVIGKRAEMDLALEPENFARFSKTGITAAMSLEAPPGKYRLRVIVEEGVDGGLSTATQSIDIP
jgi:hypothetical protein